MDERWQEVPVSYPGRNRPQTEGLAWGGLLVVGAYDFKEGFFAADTFEIWHQGSGEFMLEVRGTEQRALEIASALAVIADWAELSTTDEVMLQAKLMAFGAGYPQEVLVSNDWAKAVELDGVVPFAGLRSSSPYLSRNLGVSLGGIAQIPPPTNSK